VVKRIAEDSHGRIYLATLGGGVKVLDAESQAYALSDVTQYPPDGMDKWKVNRLHFDTSGRMWISTVENGLFRFYPDS
jgi:ligand-binding sensor domain-containing protein